ncbi:antibiotic ABC transporter ATP-binding protein [Paenibacillus dendritiformis]|uniref:ABC transporter ATP-binding protein n=1 Tax=Paenibacillus dendritiformis TaxID=130049 RepID=UPI0018CC86BD|nr:ABC transporter ATP-binding protein [Paenibacillus dendritiformis]MBG9791335.1 antibiotic ABC transporter ATP-binding protein [Paenibacillus dendritiformis]
MSQPILQVTGLEKRFNDFRALQDISFEIFPGEIVCFLGPNGAGKSTTINILAALLRYDGGEIRFQGERVEKHPARFKKSLGIVPQDIAIYENIPAEANVKFFAALYGLRGEPLQRAAEEALGFVGLSGRKREKPKTFSGGMKRRLNIACAIAHKPRFIIMDEPTVGIDPQSRNHILESIKALRDEGASIIYTTHYMEEVEEIATRIIIIDHGRMIASGTKDELKEQLGEEKLYDVEVEDASVADPDELYRIDGVKNVYADNNRIRITTLKGIENLDKIIALLMSRGMKIINLTSASASLEMVFLKLTGRTLRD